jgi:hypothetical protein
MQHAHCQRAMQVTLPSVVGPGNRPCEYTVPLSAFGIKQLILAFEERKRKPFCSLAEMFKNHFGSKQMVKG